MKHYYLPCLSEVLSWRYQNYEIFLNTESFVILIQILKTSVRTIGKYILLQILLYFHCNNRVDITVIINVLLACSPRKLDTIQ